jgi:hypothetical protein
MASVLSNDSHHSLNDEGKGSNMQDRCLAAAAKNGGAESEQSI